MKISKKSTQAGESPEEVGSGSTGREETGGEGNHSGAVAKCRSQLLIRIQSGEVSVPKNHLLNDLGATGGKVPSTLALQRIALDESGKALFLGQFSRAHHYIEALESGEQLPATHFCRAQIYSVQGYQNKAREELQSAINLMSSSPDDNTEHRRFHDLLRLHRLAAGLDDWRFNQEPGNGPQACLDLSRSIRRTWLDKLSPAEYSPVAVSLTLERIFWIVNAQMFRLVFFLDSVA